MDFRSLSVKEFGAIYEGLLESELSVAPADLTLDGSGGFTEAGPVDEVVTRKGAVYLHNQSGVRKSTASYFTKAPVVEHVLDIALEPALEAHVKRLQQLIDNGDDGEAAAAYFDFRCADLAMGSGHFLVSAVDRIEARLSRRSLP